MTTMPDMDETIDLRHPRNRRGRQSMPVQISTAAVLLIGTVLMVLPVLWMAATSLADTKYATTFPPKFFPTSFQFSNYINLFTQTDVPKYLLNSVLIVVPSIIGQVLASSFAGYALARLRAPGKRFMFIAVLATMMIPYEATIIPTFVMFRYLHWINTLWPIIVPQFFGSGYTIFLMRQFILQIPTEYDEAARLDGLGYFGIWRRIIVPLSMPAMATVGIFTFTAQWSSFLSPLIFINDPDKYPLALGIYAMTQTSNVGQTPPWNIIMAAGMILTVPMVMVYFFGQRLVYEGANSMGRIRT